MSYLPFEMHAYSPEQRDSGGRQRPAQAYTQDVQQMLENLSIKRFGPMCHRYYSLKGKHGHMLWQSQHRSPLHHAWRAERADHNHRSLTMLQHRGHMTDALNGERTQSVFADTAYHFSGMTTMPGSE